MRGDLSRRHGPGDVGEKGRVGPLGDGGDHGVDRYVALRSRHGLGTGPPAGVGRSQFHLDHPDRFDSTVASTDLDRCHEWFELHSLGQGLLDLVGRCGHLAARSPVQDRDRRVPAECRAGRVHRGIPASDDRDLRSQVDVLAVVDHGEVVDPEMHSSQVFARDPQRPPYRGAGRQEHRVMTLSQLGEVLSARDLSTEGEADAEVLDPCHLGVDDLGGQPEVRDAHAQHSPGRGGTVVHRDPVAPAGELIGAGEPCGAGADDPDREAGRLLGDGGESQVVGDGPVPEILLEGVHGDGAVLGAPGAGRFTRVRADAAQGCGEGVHVDDLQPGVT